MTKPTANEDGTVMEFAKCRVFRGDATRQSGADPEKWYYEPSDYDGDVVWSQGYGSYAEAYHAAGLSTV